ncbi:(d)CMP kinase [Polynucleobacter sp. IMCC 30228]|uniref:(d)CMP kinase n=1 Tax=Polynucleobacter sp. IMCC 30228 TaxID=2781011 RepID=UPI001F1CC891|nr:(d)CMP kinase [Polynucleobacter sp. IMCC 30228]MCE7527634.1 (d)CMP kinase [Polynucleobacter sp. IMCC 30228]
MPSLPPVIAIDGPTASGKGTVAILVAQALGFHYLESGALYRLVALASERAGLSSTKAVALGQLTATLSISFKDGLVLLHGADVSSALRAESIGKRASEVAIHPEVRAALVGLQRSFRQLPGLVADGRDMGSVIFPDASLKVYLTASVLARGQRRYKQLIAKGFSANMADLLRDLEERDARDQSRKNAPLLIAEGAKTLDTSDLSVDQAVRQVLAWYEE